MEQTEWRVIMTKDIDEEDCPYCVIGKQVMQRLKDGEKIEEIYKDYE